MASLRAFERLNAITEIIDFDIKRRGQEKNHQPLKRFSCFKIDAWRFNHKLKCVDMLKFERNWPTGEIKVSAGFITA